MWMGKRFSRKVGTAGRQSPRSPQRRAPYVALFAALAAFAFLVVIAGAQQPTERARTETLARRATDRLQALQREADRMASEERTLLGDLRKLEIERQIHAEELKRVAAETIKIQA